MFSVTTFFTCIFALFVLSSVSSAIPHPGDGPLRSRQAAVPQFPAQPPSCPLCEQGFPGIDSCAQAAPVLANVSMILFNPGAFIDVIKCACTDTFQSAYPQCVDCFEKTNQTSFLNTTNAPAVVNGIRDICSLASIFVGGAPSADGEITPTSSVASPTPTAKTGDAHVLRSSIFASVASLVLALTALF
ncbi:uncharacterized protein PHACADRAFT_198429 [Phanerochaete carnosa HHB-10118-sp]|uniref:Uncharacterized protein n=1 Tax=Phanerochaete carnosa (strain HHB-10118-sp) TaxID=650164 RepID=K5W0I4_PHACS|nr:uncharacterized protein PHACADRAFT_198429 [Phanerochaete carnosa HHB-10118-sp]EKM52374.1 hypothetical protein PHACADRAFT_198429 [Phanerochaete carnosa HHB-10118-sp]